MPTYEYECTRCGEITEEFKPVSAPRRQRCPHCRGKVERLLSGGLGVHFKGSGFYINDSRATKKGAAPAGKAAPSGKSAAAGKPAAAGNAANDSNKGAENKG